VKTEMQHQPVIITALSFKNADIYLAYFIQPVISSFLHHTWVCFVLCQIFTICVDMSIIWLCMFFVLHPQSMSGEPCVI